MCTKKVLEWLVLLSMEKYIRCFTERGYTTIAQCHHILISDLVLLGIDDPNHRQLLLSGVQLLINSPKLFACSEPCELHFRAEDDDFDKNFLDICQSDLQAWLTSLHFSKYENNKSKFEFEPKRNRSLKENEVTKNLGAVYVKGDLIFDASSFQKLEDLYKLEYGSTDQKQSEESSESNHFNYIHDSTPVVLIE